MTYESRSGLPGNKSLRWAARICLSASALAILFSSYFFYSPGNSPAWDLSPQLGQTLLYGGLVLVIAAFTLWWPGAGGAIAILYGLYKVFQFWSPFEHRLTLIPDLLFHIIYGLFIVGGILNLVVGIRQKTPLHALTTGEKRILLLSRVTTFAAVIIFAVACIFIYPPILLFPALFLIGIAWLWPTPGGLLMVFVSVTGFVVLYPIDWDFQWKWPVFVLLFVFYINGIIHLIVAWRNRKRT